MHEAELLAKGRSIAMVAAAGCGKTHAIAYAVANYATGRELILTHTHAGVDAIRARLSQLGASTGSYTLDTIAGWALRLSSAFPATAALPTAMPRSSDDYAAVYSAAGGLLRSKPVQEVVRASYSGAYVDEYQDCSLAQHALVLALSEIIPCRVLGDHLQAIFDFGEHEQVHWSEHVCSSFTEVPGPTEPHRWKEHPELGAWLQEVRTALLTDQLVDLRGAPITWVDGSDPKWKQVTQSNACRNVASKSGDETVVAIHHWASQRHGLASRLSGLFSCVEAIDAHDLFESAAAIGGSTGFARAVAVIDFAARCLTKVKTELRTSRDAFAKGKASKATKHRAQIAAISQVVTDDNLSAVESSLQAIRNLPGSSLYRRELLYEFERALRAVIAGESESLPDAAWIVRNRTRRIGRRLSRCCVGSTLLVKGLQFQHAIVLEADGYDAANLYVALTRGSKSLTVVSNSRIIRPRSGPTGGSRGPNGAIPALDQTPRPSAASRP